MINFKRIKQRIFKVVSTLGSSSRLRLIALSVITAGGARVVALLAQLAQVPIALKYLQPEAFGLWVSIVSTFQLMGFADLGMGLGFQNKISEAYARSDLKRVADLLITARRLFWYIAIALIVIGLPLCWVLPWARYFKIENSELVQQSRMAFGFALVAFAVNIPLGIGTRLATALQRSWVVNVWLASGSVLSLLVVWLSTSCLISFAWFVGLSLVPQLISALMILWHIKKILGSEFKNVRGGFDTSLLAPLFKQGTMFLIPQICGSVVNFAPAVILAMTIGPAAATPYNLCQRLANALSQLQQLPLQPLWPAYAEANAKGDRLWIGKTLMISLIYSLLSGGVIAVGIYWGGDSIIHRWANTDDLTLPLGLIIGFSIWFFLSSIMNTAAVFLNGLGALKSQVYGGALSVILALGAMPFLIARFGVSGAIFSVLLAFCLFSWPIVAWDVYSRIKDYRINRLKVAHPMSIPGK